MRPLYHLLDPLWSRLPLPVGTRFEEVQVGPVRAIRQCRTFRGRPLMWVHAYAVADTLVDTGLACLAGRLAGWAAENGVRRAVVTHHHEDHAGGSAGLLDAGLDVRATPLTTAIVASDPPIPFYEHLAWGRPPPSRPAPLGATVELDGLVAEVLPAPGHCIDQVVLHVPARGWLFAGDVFLHHRVRLFRRDEDFAATITTLRRLCDLEFDVLLCAHRPQVEGGRDALRGKLEHLLDLEGRVRTLAAEGLPTPEITRRIGPGRPGGFEALSFGDASTHNLVRNILHGPRPRPELTGITG